jgi:chitin disaccharide deacetylase
MQTESTSNCEMKTAQKSRSGLTDAASVNSAQTGNKNFSENGVLIVNADDWGRDVQTTDRMLECLLHRSVSSVSAMVFMADSERAANLASEHKVDAGLHLNLSLPFSSPTCPANIREQQRKLVVYLTRHPMARVIFNPWLAKAFEYVVKAQFEEFARVFGELPERIDGHHHLHLSANVLLKGLLPKGTLVRRNFSFLPGEKSLLNRLYRRAIDSKLANRHRMVDYLFPLSPLEPHGRLARIRTLAQTKAVEIETHPVNSDEYEFLTGDGVVQWANEVPIAQGFLMPLNGKQFAHEVEN